jgi:hypothetical protein
MALTIALFIRVRHANIHWKSDKDVYAFGIQSFMSFHLNFWSKFKIVSSLQYVPLRIPAAFVKFDKTYLLNH